MLFYFMLLFFGKWRDTQYLKNQHIIFVDLLFPKKNLKTYFIPWEGIHPVASH